MSTEVFPERTEIEPPNDSWRPRGEVAPSHVRADEPLFARVVAMASFSALVLGGFLLLMQFLGRPTLFGPSWGQFLMTIFLVYGLGGLLFHAARDGDVQVRRIYMAVGYGLQLAGVGFALVPYPTKVGDLFLPYGLLAFCLAPLFQLAYIRHETEEFYAKTTRQVIGGLGVVMAVWGFLNGSLSIDFLLPRGALLILLGLYYLTVFVILERVGTDLGYLAAQAMGALGGLVCLIAVGRMLLIAWGTLSADSGFQFMPGGMVLITGGLLYLASSAALCWDSLIVVLTGREFIRFFYSPILYFVLLGFTMIGWLLFYLFLFNPFGGLWRAGMPAPVMEPMVTGYIISWFPIICVIFVVPVITMGLLSEEQRTGTLEVLLTSPVNEPSVVISKLLGSLAFYLFIWLPWGLYLVALRVEGGQPFDYRPLLGFFIALAFTGAHFLSMGVFFSSLTRNQIISAVLTFAGMLALLLAFFMKDYLEPGSAWEVVLAHIGFIDLWINALQGKVATRDLLLHLSAAIFWTFLTVKVLESRKWR